VQLAVCRRAAPTRAAFARRLKLHEQHRRLALRAEARGADEDERPAAGTAGRADIGRGGLPRHSVERRAGLGAEHDRHGCITLGGRASSKEQRREQEQDASGHQHDDSYSDPRAIACA
jgi:hypothetical protein